MHALPYDGLASAACFRWSTCVAKQAVMHEKTRENRTFQAATNENSRSQLLRR